jgi:hypothetical protein
MAAPNTGASHAGLDVHFASPKFTPLTCGFLVERRGFEPPRFPAKTACEMRFVDPGVVTRAVPVLEICGDVLRDVTVLAAVERCSLGYELAGRRLPQHVRSRNRRPAMFSRPTCLAPSGLFASAPPCLVSKSVANPLSDKDSRLAVSGTFLMDDRHYP